MELSLTPSEVIEWVDFYKVQSIGVLPLESYRSWIMEYWAFDPSDARFIDDAVDDRWKSILPCA